MESTGATPLRARSLGALATFSRALPPLRGKGALARALMAQAEQRRELAGSWSLRIKDGTRFELPRASRQTWAVAFDGLYDPAAVAYVERFVRPGSVVLDVGASLGLWTVPLARMAAARGAQVWAFEPNPANIEWITRNVELNGLQDYVTVRGVGLGDRPEEVTLVSSEYGVGNGVIAVGESESTEKFLHVQVRIERLDDIELPAPVSFVKIDTEGYEPAFLRGAAGLIARERPVIFGEFAPVWMRARGEDLRGELREMAYDVAALEASRSHRWRSIDTVARRPLDRDGSAPLPANLLLTPS
ncbi:MAG TPA: FkbM family methyltransferase [Solirubrobacteraceae bacterium]|nr:FkbM family methyltransferase [Solirubrobacteraceae bacterium]